MAMGKTSAEALFFKRFGIEHLPLIYIALGFLLTIVSLIYATIADRMSAEKLFFRLMIFLIFCLVILWEQLSYNETSAIYPLYFLIYEATSEIMLIHMALYVNQNLNTLTSKRLLPIILAGSQLGLICGGILVAILTPVIGTGQIILLWALLLIITLTIMTLWHRLKGPSSYFYKTHSHGSFSASLQSVKKGISFTRRSSLLSASSAAFFFMVITFYTLYYVTNNIYTGYFNSEEDLAAFFGILTASTGLIALLLQVFVSNRVIAKLGVQKTNLIFPLSLGLSFSVLILSIKMPSALLGSFIKDTFNPAFNSPVRNMMYNILPKSIQGRARAVSTGIILPAALLICALLLLSARYLDNNIYFLLTGFISSLLLIYFSVRTNKAYLNTLIRHLKEQVYLPDNTLSEQSSASLLASLKQNIHSADSDLTVSCARILMSSMPQQAESIIIERLRHADSKTADQLVRILASYNTKPLLDFILRPDQYPVYDHHFEATILQLLFEAKQPLAKKYVLRALISDNPRVWATGIYGALVYNDSANLEQAYLNWLTLTRGDTKLLLAALPLSRVLKLADQKQRAQLMTNYESAFIQLLNSDKPRWQLLTLTAISDWQPASLPQHSGLLNRLFANHEPTLRAAVIKCCFVLNYDKHMDLLLKALEDGHSLVRQQALQSILSSNNADNDLTAQNWLVNNDNFTSPRAQLTIFDHLNQSDLKASTLNDIVVAKTQLGRRYYDARQILLQQQNKNHILKLLLNSIEERLEHVCQLLLSCLNALDQSNIFSIVMAAHKGHEASHIATACEALENLQPSPITSLLTDILRDDFELKTNYILGFDNIDSVLNWCKQQDQWLQTCAHKALEHDRSI